MAEDKAKTTVTVGVPVPVRVQVIFVAKYKSTPGVTSEVSTAMLRAHADKQKARAPKTTYVFEVRSLGDIRTSIEKGVAAGEVVERIDILAHGSESVVGLSGTVTADNVDFDDDRSRPAFDDHSNIEWMSVWENHSPPYALGANYISDALTWRTKVESRLTADASVNVYACNSGGLDTEKGPTDFKGTLLKGIALLFNRVSVGFAGYLWWSKTPCNSNLFAFIIGIGASGTAELRYHGRMPQADPDLSFYRDMNALTRWGFPGYDLVITENP